MRVGVVIAEEHVTVSSPGGLLLSDAANGAPVADLAPHASVRLTASGPLLAADDLDAVSAVGMSAVAVHSARTGAPVFVDGRPFRGSVEVRAVDRGRVTLVNVLPMEEYLLGVVPLEIGPREETELAAVEAQAVAARTYAVSHLGGHSEMGFDLFGTVEDQVYGGLEAERDESSRAVRRTAGRILMFAGRPIRAFYHSTCGGRTAAVEEVLDREPAPYLRSMSDRAPDGADYCSISPRYRWSVAWTPAALDSTVRPGLAAHFGVPAEVVGPVDRLAIRRRTPSGRVLELGLSGPGTDVGLSRLDIRRVLSVDGRILFSTDFSIVDGADGLVELHGRGYGHGAGMCQWGAIGRARAGQPVERILAAYYPGSELVRVYGGGGG